MDILPERLTDAGNGKKYGEGYRIVYFENIINIPSVLIAKQLKDL